jgi:hypothetical protein
LNHESILTTYFPRFCFGTFPQDKKTNELVNTYKKEQKKIAALLKSKDFIQKVVDRLSLTFDQPVVELKTAILQPKELAMTLREILKEKKLTNLHIALEAIQDSKLNKESSESHSTTIEDDEFYKLTLINSIEKRVLFTEKYFQQLSGDPSYKLAGDGVYIKTLENSHKSQ